MNNAGKLAVVTGASSGIGYELAAQFAQAGYDLLIVAENEGIIHAAEDLKQLGTHVVSARFDLATTEGVENFFQKIKQMGRPIDAIALNAGVGGRR